MKIENFSDELCVGVKGQSNRAIAGSPRNIFRYSPRINFLGVEHWIDFPPQGGGSNQTPNTRKLLTGSQSVPAKRSGPEGNNPDQQLRSLIKI